MAPILRLTEVTGWLSCFDKANHWVDIREAYNPCELVQYTNSRISSFTAFLLKAMINQQELFQESTLWLPTARKGDKTSDGDNHKYTTYVVVLTQAGVFLSDYAIIMDGNIHTLVLMPPAWLRIYDQRSVL